MAQPPSRPRPSLSPVPLQRQNSQSSLLSTTTYHSFAAPMPSPVLTRSSLHIETRSPVLRATQSPSPGPDMMMRTHSPLSSAYPSRKTPSPGAERMLRTDSGYADGHRRTDVPARTESPLSYNLDERPTRIPSPVQTNSPRQSQRPHPIRTATDTTITGSAPSSRRSSTRYTNTSTRTRTRDRQQQPTPPTSPTFTNSSRNSSVQPRSSMDPSSKPSSSRPRPNRSGKSHTGNTTRRTSRPSSTRRYNSVPVLPSREVPVQFFQFPALELDDHGAGSGMESASPPGSSSRRDQGKGLGISTSDSREEDRVVGTHVPATIQYWTSPETRRREYEAIDRAGRGVRGFCMRVLPDCLLPREYKVQGFSVREEERELDERSTRKRGRRGSEGSVRRYRIEVEEVEGEGSGEGSGKRWFSWGKA